MGEELFNVAEIYESSDYAEINEYLKSGWVLIASNQATDSESSCTLYTVGWKTTFENMESEIKHPKYQAKTGWEDMPRL